MLLHYQGAWCGLFTVWTVWLACQENYEQRLDVEWEDQYSAQIRSIWPISIFTASTVQDYSNDALQVLSNTTKNISTVNAQPTKDMKFANIHGPSALPTSTLTVVDKIRGAVKSILSNGLTVNCPSSTRGYYEKSLSNGLQKPKYRRSVQESTKASYCWPDNQEEDLDYAVRKLVNMRIFFRRRRQDELVYILKENSFYFSVYPLCGY